MLRTRIGTCDPVVVVVDSSWDTWDDDSDWAASDVDSQWGRKPQRQVRKENRRTQQQQQAQKKGRDVADQDGNMRPGSSSWDNWDDDSDWAASDVDSQWGRKPQREVPKENRRTQQQRPSSSSWDSWDDDSDRAGSDVDSQWGRKPQRQVQKENRRTQQQQQHQRDNRQTQAAIDGTDDWSVFVSSSPTAAETQKVAAAAEEVPADDFFSSLMTDLNKDLGSSGGRQRSEQQPTQSTASSADSSLEDDFFASLVTDLTEEKENKRTISSPKRNIRQQSPSDGDVGMNQDDDYVGMNPDDDFFAALEAELKTAVNDDSTDSSAPSTGRAATSRSSFDTADDTEDFFAQLEAELATSLADDDASSSGTMAESSLNTAGQRQRKPKSSSSSSSSSSSTTSASNPSSSFNAQELSQKTVPVLKDMLRDRGLKVGGKKAELVERLLES